MRQFDKTNTSLSSIGWVRKSENEEGDAVLRRLYAMLPRLRVTELFAEVDAWTGFADRLAHLRTGAPPDDERALMTAVLADATNLGLTRMARSSGTLSHSRLLWVAEWPSTLSVMRACSVSSDLQSISFTPTRESKQPPFAANLDSRFRGICNGSV